MVFHLKLSDHHLVVHTNMMYNIYEGVDAKLRTTLNISEDLIKETESIYNAKSKSEMVEMALKDAVRFKKLQKLMDLKGNIDFDEKAIAKLREAEIEENQDNS
ncbi:MAG: type II toxin-antitoxin system VapB family antitoxin [Halanaerobiaceae bacterium]